MPVRKYLELSTDHMKPSDAELLGRYSAGPNGRVRPPGGNLVVDPVGDYGWTIPVGFLRAGGGLTVEEIITRLDDLKAEGFSPEFTRILVEAAGQGLDQVTFDIDAEHEPGYPVFEREAAEEPASPTP
jgi:hypothetical protein